MARPISSSELEALVQRIEDAEDLESAVGTLAPAARRRLLTALVRACARGDRGTPAVDAEALTADDAATVAAELMKAKDVTSFELAALFNV